MNENSKQMMRNAGDNTWKIIDQSASIDVIFFLLFEPMSLSDIAVKTCFQNIFFDFALSVGVFLFELKNFFRLDLSAFLSDYNNEKTKKDS